MTMGKLLGRALGTAIVALSVLTLAGCAATVAGVAVKAPDRADADGAVVTLLDTGSYPTTPGPPFGAAGRMWGTLMEGHRIAENVVGPWQVDAAIQKRGPVLNATTTGPLLEAQSLAKNHVLADPISAVAAAHGFMAGFSSLRAAGPTKLLLNVVMRFPDVESAGAAAREMADKYPHGDVPPRPVPIDRHPEAIATLYEALGGGVDAASFTAHGPYVLVQAITIEDRNDSASAPVLIGLTLDKQEPLIDRFTPTDPAKLVDLPRDPTGQLLARTLWAPDNSGPFISGVWQPNAWLHFEDDPIKTEALFKSAGVEVVTQRMTTVYQTRDAAGAVRVAEQFAADMHASAGVHPIAGIPGLPTARCFAWPEAGRLLPEPDVPPSWLRVQWPFKCVARADHYAFTAVSKSEQDVKQQIAAQYRILAGK